MQPCKCINSNGLTEKLNRRSLDLNIEILIHLFHTQFTSRPTGFLGICQFNLHWGTLTTAQSPAVLHAVILFGTAACAYIHLITRCLLFSKAVLTWCPAKFLRIVQRDILQFVLIIHQTDAVLCLVICLCHAASTDVHLNRLV